MDNSFYKKGIAISKGPRPQTHAGIVNSSFLDHALDQKIHLIHNRENLYQGGPSKLVYTNQSPDVHSLWKHTPERQKEPVTLPESNSRERAVSGLQESHRFNDIARDSPSTGKTTDLTSSTKLEKWKYIPTFQNSSQIHQPSASMIHENKRQPMFLALPNSISKQFQPQSRPMSDRKHVKQYPQEDKASTVYSLQNFYKEQNFQLRRKEEQYLLTIKKLNENINELQRKCDQSDKCRIQSQKNMNQAKDQEGTLKNALNATVARYEEKIQTINQKVSQLEIQKAFAQRGLAIERNNLESLNRTLQKQLTEKQQIQSTIDKHIYFEEDKINAKDVQNLRAQILRLQKENDSLIDDHLKYISEVRQMRKQIDGIIKEINAKIQEVKNTQKQLNVKLDKLLSSSEDKHLLIKIQNQINFLRKKAEDQMEELLTKENQLSSLKVENAELTQKNNDKSDYQPNIYNGSTIEQIQKSIQTYENRIYALNQKVVSKQNEVVQQKKMVEALMAEVKRHRQDKHVLNLKDKNVEANLKNQIENLQRILQCEIEIAQKKASTLQSTLQRKMKDITEKDKFIKDFLISRAKTIQKDSMETLLQELKKYFEK